MSLPRPNVTIVTALETSNKKGGGGEYGGLGRGPDDMKEGFGGYERDEQIASLMGPPLRDASRVGPCMNHPPHHFLGREGRRSRRGETFGWQTEGVRDLCTRVSGPDMRRSGETVSGGLTLVQLAVRSGGGGSIIAPLKSLVTLLRGAPGSQGAEV